MERALLCGRLCNCNHSIRGADDDELFGEVLAHLRRDHPAMLFPEERILRQFVASRAYDVEEYALVYADGESPDEEEFGLEPY
jgi:predicted small metal-binding protein